MKIKKLKLKNLNDVLDIFKHENLRYTNGDYPEKNWISCLIKKGYAYGIFENGNLKGALVAEKLIMGGIYLWLISVRKEDIGKGYGQLLLDGFQKKMIKKNKNWIFLTSFNKSESFYIRNGFISNNLLVKEFCKDLIDNS